MIGRGPGSIQWGPNEPSTLRHGQDTGSQQIHSATTLALALPAFSIMANKFVVYKLT